LVDLYKELQTDMGSNLLANLRFYSFSYANPTYLVSSGDEYICGRII
jgi:hypothetical protein